MDAFLRVAQGRQSREPIEVVSLGGMEVRLLAAGDGAEIIEQVMRPGARWALCPQEGWDALEFFQVLEGRLRWQSQEGEVILGPGGSVAACPVEKEYLFQAETEVRLLYMCSQPVFHNYSNALREMMQLAVIVERKDGHDEKHCDRVMNRCMAVGRRLGLPPARLLALHYAAYLHDLGLVGVPDTILNKSDSLSDAEWIVMRCHPTIGREMVERTFMQSAAMIIEQHHERLDGRGYPHGLTGDRISLEAQVVAVADAYDAMVHDRPYRRAMQHEDAVRELQQGTGAIYRQDVVSAYVDLYATK